MSHFTVMQLNNTPSEPIKKVDFTAPMECSYARSVHDGTVFAYLKMRKDHYQLLDSLLMPEYRGGVIQYSDIEKQFRQENNFSDDPNAQVRVTMPNFVYNLPTICERSNGQINQVQPLLQAVNIYLRKNISVPLLSELTSPEFLDTFPVSFDIDQVSNICAQDSTGYFYAFLMQKVAIEYPSPGYAQILQKLMLAKPNLMTVFHVDSANAMGQAKSSGNARGDRQIIVESRFQSLRTATQDHYSAALMGYGSVVPMKAYHVDTVSLLGILTQVGGFGVAVSGIAFAVLNATLFEPFLRRQAELIRARQIEQGYTEFEMNTKKTEKAELDLIVSKLKERVSFVRMYELFDHTAKTDDRVLKMMNDFNLLQKEIKQLKEELANQDKLIEEMEQEDRYYE